jgi:hypothetical protein
MISWLTDGGYLNERVFTILLHQYILQDAQHLPQRNTVQIHCRLKPATVLIYKRCSLLASFEFSAHQKALTLVRT